MPNEKHVVKSRGGKLVQASYVFGPWHPAMVPFPIVCSMLAACAFWAGGTYEIDWLLKMAGVLWMLTFVFALASLLTGHLFAHRLGRYTQWSPLPPPSTGPLHFHALLGMIGFFISLFMLPGAYHLAVGQPVHSLTQFFLGVAAAVFFAWGAHEGGEMTFHMEMVPLSTPHSRGDSKTIHPKPRRHPLGARLKARRGNF
jgi:hypothetical protein